MTTIAIIIAFLLVLWLASRVRRCFYLAAVRDWRKHIKIGDSCCFYNIHGTKTYGTIKNLSESQAFIVVKTGMSVGYQWIDIIDLYL